jgi:hypothetical protein
MPGNTNTTSPLTGESLREIMRSNFYCDIPFGEYPSDTITFNNCATCQCTKCDSSYEYETSLRLCHEKVYMKVIQKMCHKCLCLGVHKYFMTCKKFPKMRGETGYLHRILIDNIKEDSIATYGYPSYVVPFKYIAKYGFDYNEQILPKLIEKYHDCSDEEKENNKKNNYLNRNPKIILKNSHEPSTMWTNSIDWKIYSDDYSSDVINETPDCSSYASSFGDFVIL